MKLGNALLFDDETSIELNRQLKRIWWAEGEHLEVPVDSGRQRLNLIGTCNVTDNNGFFAEIAHLDAKNFLLFVKGLLNYMSIPGKIYLVVDNASAHHAKKLRPFLRKNSHRLQVFFLPAYSPDFNPIELL